MNITDTNLFILIAVELVVVIALFIMILTALNRRR